MQVQYKIGLSLACLLLAFSFGRYSAKLTAVTTVAQSQNQTTAKDNVDTHKVEVIQKQPSGMVTDTITTDTTDVLQVNSNSKSSSTTVETPVALPKTNFSALFGTDLTKGSKALIPLYGVSIQRELIGPVSVGGFGLTSGVVGVSVGINF
jgi:hypothetical protein